MTHTCHMRPSGSRTRPAEGPRQRGDRDRSRVLDALNDRRNPRAAHRMTSASKHARFACTTDSRCTRNSPRERSLQQWKGHTLSVREQCMGKGRVRASASGWRTFRRVVDVWPEGRPIWESNPAASARSRGGTPVLGHDNRLPRVPLQGLPLAWGSAFRATGLHAANHEHPVPHTVVSIVAKILAEPKIIAVRLAQLEQCTCDDGRQPSV